MNLLRSIAFTAALTGLIGVASSVQGQTTEYRVTPSQQPTGTIQVYHGFDRAREHLSAPGGKDIVVSRGVNTQVYSRSEAIEGATKSLTNAQIRVQAPLGDNASKTNSPRKSGICVLKGTQGDQEIIVYP